MRTEQKKSERGRLPPEHGRLLTGCVATSRVMIERWCSKNKSLCVGFYFTPYFDECLSTQRALPALSPLHCLRHHAHLHAMTQTSHPTIPNTAHVTRDGDDVYAGTHLIVDIHGGCNLNDEDVVEKALRDATQATGATLLHIHTHRFSPQGVTGMAILAESHIACHTWPEIGYGAFDIFMCGATDPHAAIPILKAAFHTHDIRVTELHRGQIPR